MPRKKLIFFVPGIMGSTLVDETGRLVWSLDIDRLLLTLASSPDILVRDLESSFAPPLKPGNVIKRGGTSLHGLSQDIYGKVIRALEGRYGVDAVVQFPYDWRRSNRDSARLLSKKIATVTGDFDIFLVGHSMGGLICALALSFLQGDPVLQKVVRVITIGSPFLGSSRSFRTLNEGRPRIHRVLDRLFWALRSFSPYGSEQLADALRQFPSIYELLPHRESKILTRRGKTFHALDLNRNTWRTDQKPLIKAATQVHSQLRRIDTTRLHAIYSDGIDTEFGYRLDKDYKIVGPPNSSQPGDDTVTSLSAQGRATDGAKHPFGKIKHVRLPADPDILATVQALIG